MKKGKKMTDVQKAKHALRCRILDWKTKPNHKGWFAIERSIAKLAAEIKRELVVRLEAERDSYLEDADKCDSPSCAHAAGGLDSVIGRIRRNEPTPVA